MVGRILVTTAIEETWPKGGEPILFLGEWCKLYNRKACWEKLDAEVAPYHWDNRVKLCEDYHYLGILYEYLLVELAQKLNHIHGVEHSDRYWRVLIGPWLGLFIQILFDRWFMLKQVIETGNVLACNIIERNGLVVPNNMLDFQKLSITDEWNEAIYGQLLQKLWARNAIHISNIRKTKSAYGNDGHGRVANLFRSALKRKVHLWLTWLNGLQASEDVYFFQNTYLARKVDLMLQLRLGQIPKIWRQLQIPQFKLAASRRTWLMGCKDEDRAGSFEELVREMIPLHIPTAYLEGYDQLIGIGQRLPWPKMPKVIFTSIGYWSDDLFKSWAAQKVEAGAKLVIGQHGGHFGMTPFAFHEEHQIKIADKWISWGWHEPQQSNVVPVGNLKSFGRTVKYDPDGGALMLEMAIPRYSYHLYAIPIARQYIDYLSEQKRFFATLTGMMQQQIILRLYPHDYGWCQTERWKDQFSNAYIDMGCKNIRDMVAKSRIYISTYNATTYLESLSWNVPTIMFWNPKHWELRDSALPFFERLKSVGIFHETPESAARQMMAVWDDVAGWWESATVQSARQEFCERYAHIPKDPLDVMEKLFREIAET